MPDIDSPALFVALEIKPQLYIISNPGIGALMLGTPEYRLVESGIGFYDFLRNRDMAIIGLRFSPFGHHPILDYALPLSYTYVDIKRSYMEVYFRGHRGLSITGTAEQAFGDDAVWRNEMGVYALQVGTTPLTQGELDSLSSSPRSSTDQSSASLWDNLAKRSYKN